MSQKDKLVTKARANPGSLSFREFEALMLQCGWAYHRQVGSHRMWVSPQKSKLPVQPRKDKMAKIAQVRQFFDLWDDENE